MHHLQHAVWAGAAALRGRLRARLSVDGSLDDLGSYRGHGRIEADAYNLLDLPLFLGIVKSLDVFGLLGGSAARTSISSSRSRTGRWTSTRGRSWAAT